MTEILIVIILICGFIAVAQAVNSMSENPRAFIPVMIILAFLYMLTVGSVWYVYLSFGRNDLVIYGGLAMVAIIMLVLFVKLLTDHRHSMSKLYGVVFLVYFFLILYLTLFSRKLGSDGSVEDKAFRGLELAIASHSIAPMEHSLLNLALFLPFGFIIPNINSRHLACWGFAVIGGLMTSTVIEGVQMIAGLGQCDIDDIIFNTIGAALGYIFFVFKRQVNKNWHII